MQMRHGWNATILHFKYFKTSFLEMKACLEMLRCQAIVWFETSQDNWLSYFALETDINKPKMGYASWSAFVLPFHFSFSGGITKLAIICLFISLVPHICMYQPYFCMIRIKN